MTEGARRAWSPRVRSLCLTLVLFLSLTLAQVIAGVLSHSLTLIGDAVSMGVDSLSYLGNILSECSGATGLLAERNHLVASGASLLVLFAITVTVLAQALRLVGDAGADAVPTDPGTVFVFGLLGLVLQTSHPTLFILSPTTTPPPLPSPARLSTSCL